MQTREMPGVIDRIIARAASHEAMSDLSVGTLSSPDAHGAPRPLACTRVVIRRTIGLSYRDDAQAIVGLLASKAKRERLGAFHPLEQPSRRRRALVNLGSQTQNPTGTCA